jgi:hypothetical protein
MYQPAPEQLLSLLQTIGKNDIETFTHFPDIVRAGTQLMDKEEIEYLSAEGYLEERKTDSFGKFLRLTEQANRLLKKTE